jgi:cobalt-zinc-cadmium resistance protein CzcA
VRDVGALVARLQNEVREKVKLPEGYFITYEGEFQAQQDATQRIVIFSAVVFVVIVFLLYGYFQSWLLALQVMLSIPLALVGGVAALMLRGMPFSISAAVGFIALSGIAVLNGLVMVSFIENMRKSGATLDEAVFAGSIARLRPVLMTALVASLGFVPMAIATGMGAEVQRPLATVVIGGILSSTALTLLVLPVLYRLFHRDEPYESSPEPE